MCGCFLLCTWEYHCGNQFTRTRRTRTKLKRTDNLNANRRKPHWDYLIIKFRLVANRSANLAYLRFTTGYFDEHQKTLLGASTPKSLPFVGHRLLDSALPSSSRWSLLLWLSKHRAAFCDTMSVPFKSIWVFQHSCLYTRVFVRYKGAFVHAHWCVSMGNCIFSIEWRWKNCFTCEQTVFTCLYVTSMFVILLVAF